MTDLFLHFGKPVDQSDKIAGKEWLPKSPFRAFVKANVLQPIDMLNGGYLVMNVAGKKEGFVAFKWHAVTETHTPSVGGSLHADAVIDDSSIKNGLSDRRYANLIEQSMRESGWSVERYTAGTAPRLTFEAWVREQLSLGWS